MAIQKIDVGSRADWLKLRAHDVTASAAGALFGVHPYVSAYGLYALKSGLNTEDAEESQAMRRGRLLEPVAVQLLREERPDWKVLHNSGPKQFYMRDSELRIGATPDVLVQCPQRGKGVIQVKNIEPRVFREKWQGGSSKGEIEIPLWIVIQAIVEARLCKADFACVTPMVVSYGVNMPILDIPLHDGIWNKLVEKVGAFWDENVAKGVAPPADYAQDGELIASMYAEADGSTIDLSGDNRIMEILAQREVLKAREADGNAAEKARKMLDAEILHKLGNATVADLGNGVTVSAPTTHRNAYEVKAGSYRAVKVKGFKLPPGPGARPAEDAA